MDVQVDTNAERLPGVPAGAGYGTIWGGAVGGFAERTGACGAALARTWRLESVANRDFACR